MHFTPLIACTDRCSSMPNLRSSDVIRQYLFPLFFFHIYKRTMSFWIKVLSTIVIGLCVIHLRTTSAIGNEFTPGNEDGENEDGEHSQAKDLIIGWIEKPPYTTSPTNGSLDDEAHGMLRDVLLRYITEECRDHAPFSCLRTFRADSKFHMIELLRQNKVHLAAPIFESTNRRHNEFLSFKITDYPGSEFITSEDEASKLSLVLHAVLKSWSLFAVTLILTAIAGVIMWALVCLTLCN